MSKCGLKDSLNSKKIAKRYGDVKRPDMDSTRGQAPMLHPNSSNMIKCDPLGGSDRKAKNIHCYSIS